MQLDPLQYLLQFGHNNLPKIKVRCDTLSQVCETWRYIKDSFITQDRNEHFEGGTHEATFSRGHSSLNWGTIFKNWVPNERYGYYLSTDTLWVVAGQMVWSQQPCKVKSFFHFFKSKFLKNWPFSLALKTLFLHTFLQNALI